MSHVLTKKGLIARDKLKVKDIVEEHPHCRVVATEWFDEDGELVRRDVNVNVLAGQSLTGEQGGL